MNVPEEKVEAEIAKAFKTEARRLQISGKLLSNDHTDKIDGAEIDVEWPIYPKDEP